LWRQNKRCSRTAQENLALTTPSFLSRATRQHLVTLVRKSKRKVRDKVNYPTSAKRRQKWGTLKRTSEPAALLHGGADFGLVHEALQVEHEQEAGFKFAYAGDVLAFDGADARSWLDGVSADAQDLADGVDNEAEGLPMDFNDDDAGVLVSGNRFEAEAAAQGNDGNDLAAQIDDTFDVAGQIGHAGQLLRANDFLDAQDVEAVLLGCDTEADELQELRVGGRIVR